MPHLIQTKEIILVPKVWALVSISQLIIRVYQYPLHTVAPLVVGADEALLGHARIHVVTEFLAVNVAEYLVGEPTNGLGGRASALGFEALGFAALDRKSVV